VSAHDESSPLTTNLKPPAAPQVALPTSAGTPSLDSSLLQGIAWTGGMKWIIQGVTWISTIVVARLLTPEDYGIVAMASLLMGLLTLLSEAGIGLAVVTMRDLTSRQISQVNGLSIIAGITGTVIAVAASQPLAFFFQSPPLSTVVIVMSLGFAVSAFRVIPYALLQREMRFRLLALIDGFTAVLAAAVMILLAWLGFRYWTLVIGGLVTLGVSTVLALIKRPHPIAWPRRDIAAAARFSGHTLVSRLAWYAYSNADFAIAGRILGQAALGAYGFAWKLAMLPVEKVTAMVTRVTSAVFASLQHDHAELRRYLLNITEGIAIVTFPMTIGLALVADTLVPLVLGDQWLSMIVPLQIIALYASVRTITPLLPQILTATRETRYNMWNNVFAAVLLPVAFVIGAQWGIIGIALAWVVAHPIILFGQYRKAFSVIGMPPLAYLRCLWPAVSSTLLMVGAVLLVKWTGAGRVSAPLGLALQIAAGGVAYAGAVLLLHGVRLRTFYRTLRSG
jgi:O-antigen/teichoic acid export membrane protein